MQLHRMGARAGDMQNGHARPGPEGLLGAAVQVETPGRFPVVAQMLACDAKRPVNNDKCLTATVCNVAFEVTEDA